MAKAPRKRGRLGRLLDLVMALVTLAAAAVLLCSYLAPYVNPNRNVIFAFAGLIAPALYIVNAVMLFYWLIRGRKWAFLPLVTMVLGINSIFLIFRPTLAREYPYEREKGSMTLVTHNVHGFLKPSDGTPCMDSTLTYLSSLKPDILCMQEYQITPTLTQDMAAANLPTLPHKRAYYKLPYDDGGFGLAIYSKYPILESGSVDFEGSTSFIMWADLLVARRDTVRVYNCHLQTTSIDAADKQFLAGGEFAYDDTGRTRNIASKLKRNFRIRANQADSIAVLLGQYDGKAIVCGDFNDTPVSYTYHTVRGRLRDSFVEKGRGITNTYHGFFNLIRIDYVFHSSDYKTLHYSNPYTRWSDHNPVVVNLKKR